MDLALSETPKTARHKKYISCEQTRSPVLRSLRMKLNSTGPVVSEKIFENVDRQADEG